MAQLRVAVYFYVYFPPFSCNNAKALRKHNVQFSVRLELSHHESDTLLCWCNLDVGKGTAILVRTAHL